MTMKKAYYDTHNNELDEDEENEDCGPSKSQRKRDAEALQTLGQELTRLAPDQLERIELPENILLAISDYKKMKSFGAQRRQLQLLGKYMRQLDAAAVREAIDRATGDSRAAVNAQHRAEKWRDTMIGSDEQLTLYLEKYAEVDVQHLRQLIRSARKEAAAGKPPKSARELYRLLYSIELPRLELYAQDETEME